MAERIANQPTVLERFAGRLVEEGVVTQEEVDSEEKALVDQRERAHQALKDSFSGKGEDEELPAPADVPAEIVTAVPAEQLQELNRELMHVPDDFTVHPKLARQLERRVPALEEGGIDWGQAESLAFATLLVEGIPIRLTGQDTERGTFSHRHLVLHDAETGERYAPIQNLDEAEASFEVYNSPLSEYGAVGFEYGYSISASEALVLWEAQFGDFVNGAQIVIDQFIVSGRAKWGQTSRLTLLLPHGYEGNGPEHSSARLERFLQLAAEGNIRVANPSTRGAVLPLDPAPGPEPERAAPGRDDAERAAPTEGGRLLARGADQWKVPAGHRRPEGRQLTGCVGSSSARGSSTTTSSSATDRRRSPWRGSSSCIPSPSTSSPSSSRLSGARGARVGSGGAAEHGRLPRHAPSPRKGPGVPLRYIGRRWRASTSEGYPTTHAREQERIVREA